MRARRSTRLWSLVAVCSLLTLVPLLHSDDPPASAEAAGVDEFAGAGTAEPTPAGDQIPPVAPAGSGGEEGDVQELRRQEILGSFYAGESDGPGGVPSANLLLPSLDDVMQRFAQVEQAMQPFTLLTEEVYRVDPEFVDRQNPIEPWADGRHWMREIESTYKAPYDWRRLEKVIVDGAHHSVAETVARPVENPSQQGPMPVAFDPVTPLLGVFPLRMAYPSEGTPLLSEFYKQNPEAVSLTWDGGIAKLDFDYGPELYRSHFTLHLDSTRWYQPTRMIQSMNMKALGEGQDVMMSTDWTVQASFPPPMQRLASKGKVTYRKSAGEQPPEAPRRGTLAAAGSEAFEYTVYFQVNDAVLGDDVYRRPVRTTSTPYPIAEPTPTDKLNPLRGQQVPVLTLELAPSDTRMREVIFELEKAGPVRVSDGSDRVGQPVEFLAELHMTPDTPTDRVQELIARLQEQGIPRFALKANAKEEANRVLIICPASVTWKKVKELQTLLESLAGATGEVRVAGSDEPVTPTVRDHLPAWPPPHLSLEGVRVQSNAGTPPRRDIVPNVPLERLLERELSIAAYTLGSGSIDKFAKILDQLLRNQPTFTYTAHGDHLLVSADAATHREIERLLKLLNEAPPSASEASDPFGETKAPMGAQPTDPPTGPTYLNIDLTGRAATAEELRTQYRAVEGTTLDLAQRLKQAQPSSEAHQALVVQLRMAVELAFELQLLLQQTELEEMANRLQKLRQTIELRKRLTDEIINRRVEELQRPDLQWKPTPPVATPPATRSPADMG
ncbi:MAG: hypothetical protein R3B90_04120 [Planctomycetaceae bacterium]